MSSCGIRYLDMDSTLNGSPSWKITQWSIVARATIITLNLGLSLEDPRGTAKIKSSETSVMREN